MRREAEDEARSRGLGTLRLWGRAGAGWGARIYPDRRTSTPKADIRVRAPGQARACRWRHFLLVAWDGPGPSAAPRAGGLFAFDVSLSGCAKELGCRPGPAPCLSEAAAELPVLPLDTRVPSSVSPQL